MDSDLPPSTERPYMELVEVELKMSAELTTSDGVKTLLVEIAEGFDLELLETTTHEFAPQGITGLAVIGESHIAVHTWPENDYCHVLLSSCSELPSMSDIATAFEKWGHTVFSTEKTVNRN